MDYSTDLLKQATEVFARGFSFTKSFTHPYPAQAVEGLWLLSDSPQRRAAGRRDEWIAHEAAPELVAQAAKLHSGQTHCISLMCGPETSSEVYKSGFKGLGYRFAATEAVMIHQLKRIPRPGATVEIVRVGDSDLAKKVNSAARARQILPEHIGEDIPLRQYAALEKGQVVGWVRSISVDQSTWCSNMFVLPEFRRRGIGKMLMCCMLRDDRKYGSAMSVLTASHAGSHLYPLVGYRQIGTLLFFTMKKGK